MRIIVKIFISGTFIYFVAGLIATKLGYMENENYTLIATIIGAASSAFGMIGLFAPKIKPSDFREIEIETLKSLTKTAEEIQKKEAELNNKQNDISKLELQKKELEFIVRKASLNLFLKEQMERQYEKLDSLITENSEISRTIKDIKELEYKTQEVKIEIEKNPNIESILKIIEDTQKHAQSTRMTFLEIVVKAATRVFLR